MTTYYVILDTMDGGPDSHYTTVMSVHRSLRMALRAQHRILDRVRWRYGDRSYLPLAVGSIMRRVHRIPPMQPLSAITFEAWTVKCEACGGSRCLGYGHVRVWCEACAIWTPAPEESGQLAWYYRACLPGCLPDGEPVGPFDSEQLALADAGGE